MMTVSNNRLFDATAWERLIPDIDKSAVSWGLALLKEWQVACNIYRQCRKDAAPDDPPRHGFVRVPIQDGFGTRPFLTVIHYPPMADHRTPLDMDALRKWLHEVNNHMGVILATAELLQLEKLPPQTVERCHTIEAKAIEVRDVLRLIGDHYL